MSFNSRSILDMTRFEPDEAWERKCAIRERGQPVRVTVEVWAEDEGGLLVFSLAPLEGFVHLVVDPDACIKEFGAYHVSICQMALVSPSEMAELRTSLDNLEITLPISWVSGEGCMELGDCPLTEGLPKALHDNPEAWYCNRPMHISG